MARFMTFKRWALKDVGEESELLRLVREKILPAYVKLPGCLGLGLQRIEGTRSYLAIQYWESKAAREAAISSQAYPEWFSACESPRSRNGTRLRDLRRSGSARTSWGERQLTKDGVSRCEALDAKSSLSDAVVAKIAIARRPVIGRPQDLWLTRTMLASIIALMA